MSARSLDGLAKPKTFLFFVLFFPLVDFPAATLSKSLSNKSKYIPISFVAHLGLARQYLKIFNCDKQIAKQIPQKNAPFHFAFSLYFPFSSYESSLVFHRRISEGLLIENHSWQTSDRLPRPHYLLQMTS